MNKEKILAMVSEYREDSFFTGSVHDFHVNQIEELLEVTLPDDYKWFVKNFGHGGIGGVDILGVSKTELPTCVKFTQRYREYGLPHSFVVIENCDEWVNCLDTASMKNGECPVVDWDRFGSSRIKYNNFYDFLLDQFKEAIDNLDD
ncbi:SMI1/KNR4 family protein [Desmospora activa]|uniref:SUKH superfamily protein n=1 Tax=Desmospora activa DSM 45169 TaxID=1121389 RepID=A0A2T4Z6N8_9BACL|nr:SMI1/KNR4 family protein [Desmospora activa]PTM57554.1 SUKH superfamily protein [Desmospora activa DSM 45169]